MYPVQSVNHHSGCTGESAALVAPARPSSVDFAPMSDSEHEDQRFGVLDPRNDVIIADPISPEFAEALALQCVADRTGGVRYPVAEKARNAPGGLGIEFVEFPRGGPLELNPPRHGGG